MKLKAVNKNKEFLRAYRRGQSFVGSLVVVYVLKNRYGFTRFGVTSSKKIGNAVKRNRARRAEQKYAVTTQTITAVLLLLLQ